MEVTLRLQRLGAKRQPSYRVVVVTREQANKGKFLENVGLYNPRTEPRTIRLKADRIEHWMKRGAKPSETVKKLMGESRRREREAKKA